MNEIEKDLFNNILPNKTLPELKKLKNKKNLLIIVLSIGILSLIIALILMLTLGKNDNNKIHTIFNPIPEHEYLNFTEEEHRHFSREVATQTMVLATNNGLPIETTDQVVLFGSGTNNTVYGAEKIYVKGTSKIISPVTILEGFENKILENKNKCIYIENSIGYEIGKSEININKALSENDIEFFSIKREGAKRTVAIMTISRTPVEYGDIPQDQSIYGTQLSDSEIETYNSLKKYFDYIVIILNVGTMVELNDMERDPKTSILIVFYPGMEAGNAIADVLFGDVNPSGHLSFTWAKKINEYPTTLTFLESENYVKYKEGLFVGYRYFEDDTSKQSKVVFPFGHGLSYTKFKIDNSIKFNKGKFKVSSKVTNIGKRSGKCVVQVYVKKPQNENFIKVQRELIGFGKTKELEENESQILNIEFNLNDLASYDDIGITGNRACYVLEKGNYEIYIGESVADTRNSNNLVFTYTHNELTVVEKLTNRIVPQDPDIFDSNKKPNFENLTNISNNDIQFGKNYGKIFKQNSYISNDIDKQNIYSEVPTNNFNEINFKTVLQKKYTMNQLVDSMNLEELIFLSYGKQKSIREGKVVIGGLYNSGITSKYNIPYADILDGPGGLSHSEISLQSTSWPCATALASSFDPALLQKIGEKIGKESRKIKNYFWISPGLNIQRSPLYGNNHELFSEDPFLSGKMAAFLTKGVQSKRVSIVLKSFAFDNKIQNSNGEYDRNNLPLDSRIAERVAREIYLKAFKIAIKEGKPWSIMTSTNRINNMKASESYELLTIILREEWKYEGFVMTGWYSNSKHDREMHAGVSVKIPNNNPEKSNTILNGLIKGTVTINHLKRNILYFLNNLSKTACIDSLFVEPRNKLIIKEERMKIKIMDYIYRKSNEITYDICTDEDGGYCPINTMTNSWISFYVYNEKEQYRRVRIRYSGALDGFGIEFSVYQEILGEITNLGSTEHFDNWNTTNAINIKLPKGSYELTLRILGYDYSSSEYYGKGRINWIEFL